jgi:hypothetical protein
MQAKSIALGLVIGAIIVVVVGFNLMGWKTRAGSEEATKAAMKHSAVCVAKFVKAPDYPARVKELSGKYAFEIGPYLEKGGFAKVEGPAPEYSIGEACSAGVESLVGK